MPPAHRDPAGKAQGGEQSADCDEVARPDLNLLGNPAAESVLHANVLVVLALVVLLLAHAAIIPRTRLS